MSEKRITLDKAIKLFKEDSEGMTEDVIKYWTENHFFLLPDCRCTENEARIIELSKRGREKDKRIDKLETFIRTLDVGCGICEDNVKRAKELLSDPITLSTLNKNADFVKNNKD